MTKSLSIDALEPRRLLSISLSDGVLLVLGSSRADNVSISRDAGGGALRLRDNRDVQLFDF